MDNQDDGSHVLDLLIQVSCLLSRNGFSREGNAFKYVSEVCATATSYGGLGLSRESPTTAATLQEVNLLLDACKSAFVIRKEKR